MIHITSLDAMEQIVKKNKFLFWDGWNVLYRYPNPVAWRQTDGVFVKGKWFTQKRFELTSKGWDIPKKLVR
jgi:hypothetical protein